MRGKSAFRSIATILVAVAIVAQLARILSLGGRNDTTPFFSANDRSRWCTVASLVEDGCYEIDRVIQLSDDGKRRPWYTIDMVRHVGRDGQLHYYIVASHLYWPPCTPEFMRVFTTRPASS